MLAVLLTRDSHTWMRELNWSITVEVRCVNASIPHRILTINTLLLNSGLGLAILLAIWRSMALIRFIGLADAVQLLALSSPILLLRRWLDNLTWVLVYEHAFTSVFFSKTFILDGLNYGRSTWLIIYQIISHNRVWLATSTSRLQIIMVGTFFIQVGLFIRCIGTDEKRCLLLCEEDRLISDKITIKTYSV